MAASKKGIKAGEAYVELTLFDGMSKQLDAVGKKFGDFGRDIAEAGAGIAAIGAIILAPIVEAVASITELGSRLNDLSGEIGINTTALQTLGYAAGQTGASQDDLATGVKKSQKLLAAARKGSKQAAGAIAGLGLSVDELIKLSPDDQFREMGLAIGAIEDPAMRTAAAMAVFGKSGTKLIPMFSQGREALAAMERQLIAAGAVLSPEQIKWADAFGDAIGLLSLQFTGLKGAVAGALLPALTGLAMILSDSLPPLIEWVNAHQELTQAAALAGVSLLGLGAALGVVAAGVIGTGWTIGSLATIAGVVGPAVGGGVALIGAAFAALVSPIGLAIAAIAAVGAAVLYFTGTGEAALKGLSDGFSALYGTATETLRGIADAIAGGDLQLAGAIATTGIVVAFLDLGVRIRSAWIGVRDWFIGVTMDLVSGIGIAFTNLVASIESAWAAISGGGEAELTRIETIRRQTVEEFGRDSAKADRERAAASAKELEGAKAEQALAEKALDLLNARAEAKKAAVVAAAPGGGGEADPMAGSAGTRSLGTFNQAVIRGLMGGAGNGVQEKQLGKLDEIAKNTNKLIDAFEDGQPEFE